MNSYIIILSFPQLQQPRILTRVMCWSLDMSINSFLNSGTPWLEHLDNFLMAIFSPICNFPRCDDNIGFRLMLDLVDYNIIVYEFVYTIPNKQV